MRRFHIGVSLVLLFFAAQLRAQDPPSVPEPLQPAPPTATNDAGGAPMDGEAETPAATKPKSDDGTPNIIYVPFKDLEGAFEKPDTDVVLPYAEYRKLLKLWQEQHVPKSAPDGVITGADYVVSIDDEIARIQATYQVNVLGKPWVEVPLQFGSAAIGSVTGDDVLLRGTGDGTYLLLFGKAGKQEVVLELATQVHQSPEGQHFEFNVPSVAVTTLDITVPKKDQTIEITPNVVDLKADPVDNATRRRVNLGATKTIKVNWHPKTSLQPEMNLLTSVTNNTLVSVEDGLVHTDAWLNYQILRGKLDQLRVAVPKGHRILDVTSSARIRSWKAQDEDNQQTINIEFLASVEKNVLVEVHTERKLEGIEFDAAGIAEDGTVHGIHAIDAVRESGQIVVRHGADLTLTVQQQQGVVRIQQSEVAEQLQGNNALMYKFYSPKLALVLAAKPVEPRILVAHAVTEVFRKDELRFTSELQYSVERVGIFDVSLQLPDDVKIDTVTSPYLKEYNVDEEKKQLSISFNERRQGAIPIVVTGHRDLSGDNAKQNLPIIEPLNVERETGTIFVFAEPSIEIVTDQDGLQNAQPSPQNVAVPQAVRQIQAAGGVAWNSAWTFTRRPVVIPVTTSRKPTRLSSSIATTVDVQPELTKVTTQLDFVVEYAGIDTFRFEVPESISEDIRIELASGDRNSAPIKQKTPSDAVDGWVTWTVVTQREVLGRQRLIVRYDVQPADATEESEEDAASETTVSMTAIRPLPMVDDDGNVTTPLSRIQGEIAVKKERSLAINANAEGGDAEAIDIRELTLIPQQGALAYRYFKDADDDHVKIAVTQVRHEIQEVVSTIVSRSLVEVVAGEDPEANYRVRMLVKSTERQRLLVHLPINLQVLATFVNDREVKLEKAEDAESIGEFWTPFWVNVARTESSEEPFLMTFQFLWDVNPSLGESQYGRGTMSLPLPAVGTEAGVVQELKVVVWVPDDYSLVGDPPQFDLLTQTPRWSQLTGEVAVQNTDWLEEWVSEGRSCPTGFAQFPTEGRHPYVYTNLGGTKTIDVVWWNKLVMTLIFSVSVALIGWILMKTSWENKLTLLILAGLVITLYGLKDAHALRAGLYMARFGTATLFGLWIIHALLGWTSTPAAAATPTPVAMTTSPADIPATSDLELPAEPTSDEPPPEVEASNDEANDDDSESKPDDSSEQGGAQ